MNDPIERADATETFAELYDIFDDYPNIVKELHKVYDKILAIPSAENKGEWIPCSERLPEENGKSYLTFQCGDDIRFGWCQVLRYDDGWNCFKGDKESEIKCVVAWMPLPKPWEGEDDA